MLLALWLTSSGSYATGHRSTAFSQVPARRRQAPLSVARVAGASIAFRRKPLKVGYGRRARSGRGNDLEDDRERPSGERTAGSREIKLEEHLSDSSRGS
jgi:hypothetical protein